MKRQSPLKHDLTDRELHVDTSHAKRSCRSGTMPEPDLDEYPGLLTFATPPQQRQHYELATHSVKVRRTGGLSGVNKLWDSTLSEAMSASINMEYEKLKFFRVSSSETFDQVSTVIAVYESYCFAFIKVMYLTL